MSRFFKIIRCVDNGVANIILAANEQEAWFIANNDFGFAFTIVECEEREWFSWRWINWSEVDRLENDMVSMDSF